MRFFNSLMIGQENRFLPGSWFWALLNCWDLSRFSISLITAGITAGIMGGVIATGKKDGTPSSPIIPRATCSLESWLHHRHVSLAGVLTLKDVQPLLYDPTLQQLPKMSCIEELCNKPSDDCRQCKSRMSRNKSAVLQSAISVVAPTTSDLHSATTYLRS